METEGLTGKTRSKATDFRRAQPVSGNPAVGRNGVEEINDGGIYDRADLLKAGNLRSGRSVEGGS
jgi:hypothetical protein